MSIYLALQPAGSTARLCHHSGGGLLPHLFTLTLPEGKAVILCYLNHTLASIFPLGSAVLYVARTFLSLAAATKPPRTFRPQK